MHRFFETNENQVSESTEQYEGRDWYGTVPMLSLLSTDLLHVL
jgi:hypothetical protein